MQMKLFWWLSLIASHAYVSERKRQIDRERKYGMSERKRERTFVLNRITIGGCAVMRELCIGVFLLCTMRPASRCARVKVEKDQEHERPSEFELSQQIHEIHNARMKPRAVVYNEHPLFNAVSMSTMSLLFLVDLSCISVAHKHTRTHRPTINSFGLHWYVFVCFKMGRQVSRGGRGGTSTRILGRATWDMRSQMRHPASGSRREANET